MRMLIFAAFYVYGAFCLLTLAKKTGHHDRAWWAWLPILNVFLMLDIARKSWWWFVGLVIPFVGFVFLALVWMAIAAERGRNKWIGLLILVPIANIVLPAYLAFTGDPAPAAV